MNKYLIIIILTCCGKIDDNLDIENNKLIEYAKNGELGKVKECIEKGSDVDNIDEDGKTALILATENDHIEVVEYLIGL